MQNGQIATQIDTLLYSTHRPGIENVIEQLHSNDDAFYMVPASTKYHDNFPGGLASHSLDVYLEAKSMYEKLVDSGLQPSIIKKA
jgi:23S rRNA maturation-related 3'-5' exoribonuclease YhaM